MVKNGIKLWDVDSGYEDEDMSVTVRGKTVRSAIHQAKNLGMDIDRIKNVRLCATEDTLETVKAAKEKEAKAEE